MFHDELSNAVCDLSCTVFDPREIPGEKRSSVWEELCEATSRLYESDQKRRAALVRLWTALGFFKLIGKVATFPDDADIRTSYDAASLAWHIAFLSLLCRDDTGSDYEPFDFCMILRLALAGSSARFASVLMLIVYYGRFKKTLAKLLRFETYSSRRLNCFTKLVQASKPICGSHASGAQRASCPF